MDQQPSPASTVSKHSQTMAPVIPTELLQQVVSETHSADRKWIYSLLLVNKDFYRFATPIFYNSIVVGGVHTRNHAHHHHHQPQASTSPHTRMHFSAQSLDSLHSSLADNPALSSHIQSLIVINNDHSTDMFSRSFSFRDDHDLWQRLGAIFATLSNLKRLYIAPSQSDTTTPLQSFPLSVGITHLSSDSYWDYQDILHFLERPNQRRSIRYLRILEDGHPRFRPNPLPSGNFVNLHTIDGYPRLWYTFVKNGAPIEHLAAQFADTIDFIDPALVFRGIRTLQISSWSRRALSEPLPHLKSIELLHVTLTTYDAKIPLEDLFSIPSTELKYLRIDSSDDHEHYAQKLLNHFPSLVLLDFRRINPSEPSRRYTRRQSDALGESEVTCEMLPSRCFRVYSPAFTSWWEQFQEDFDKVGLVFQPLEREEVI